MNPFRLLTRSKLFVPGVFLVVGLIIVLLAMYWNPRDIGRECYDKCNAVNRFSRLVPKYPPSMVASGKQNPMLCECY